MDFVSNTQLMAAQLRDLNAPVTDMQLMAKITNELRANEDYHGFVSNWEMKPVEERTIPLLIGHLVRIEKALEQKKSDEETT